MILKQGGQRFLKWKFKSNWRKFQEHINTFQEHKRCLKYNNKRLCFFIFLLFLGPHNGLAYFQKPMHCYVSMLRKKINVLPPLRNKLNKLATIKYNLCYQQFFLSFFNPKSIFLIARPTLYINYPKVSNRRWMWNSRGGWKKLKILIAGVGAGGWGWLLNCFFLSLCNHENYSIKNIWVYSKSKITTKVTSKQNL